MLISFSTSPVPAASKSFWLTPLLMILTWWLMPNQQVCSRQGRVSPDIHTVWCKSLSKNSKNFHINHYPKTQRIFIQVLLDFLAVHDKWFCWQVLLLLQNCGRWVCCKPAQTHIGQCVHSLLCLIFLLRCQPSLDRFAFRSLICTNFPGTVAPGSQIIYSEWPDNQVKSVRVIRLWAHVGALAESSAS